MAWYLSHRGQRLGPLTVEELQAMAARGALAEDALVLAPDEEIWQPARSIPALLPLSSHCNLARGGVDITEDESASEITDRATSDRAACAASPAIAIKSNRRNFFIRYWRGDLSLPVSYWGVNGFFVLASVLGAKSLGKWLASLELMPWQIFFSSLGICAGSLLLVLWQYVGLWRSAAKHKNRGGRAFWGGLVRVLIVIGTISTAYIYSVRVAPSIIVQAKTAIDNDEMEPYRISVLNGGREIALTGALKWGVSHALDAALDATPSVRIVNLTSGGGWVDEGIALNHLIHRRGLTTFIATECYSSCTVAFLGGKKRYIAESAKLGFHRSSHPAKVDVSGLGGFGPESVDPKSNLPDEYRRMGLPDSFITQVMATPSNDIWRPSTQELLEAHVIDDVVDGDLYASSGLGISILVRGIEKELLKESAFASLAKYDPINYGTFRDIIVQATKKGLATPEILVAAQQHMAAIIEFDLKLASNEAIIRYAKSMVEGMRQLSNRPTQCVSLFGEGSLSAQIPPETRHILSDGIAQLIEDAVTLRQKIPAEDEEAFAKMADSMTALKQEQYESDLDDVVASVNRKSPDAISVLADQAHYDDHPEQACRAFITFYTEVLAIPDSSKAGQLLRYLFSSGE